MKRSFALALLLASTCASLHAQDKPPAVLWDAAQCLATGKYEWVNVDNTKTLALGYHEDNKTFEGGKYLYVVVFTSPKRDQGKIFDIRIKGRRHYIVENNATFVSTPNGITFPNPPLGGNWAQNQLTTAIQQILKHKKWYEAQVKYLVKGADHITCETAVEDQVEPKK